jgi:hypothetical protein
MIDGCIVVGEEQQVEARGQLRAGDVGRRGDAVFLIGMVVHVRGVPARLGRIEPAFDGDVQASGFAR